MQAAAGRKPASQPAGPPPDVRTLLRQGQVEQALRLVQEAVKASPTDPGARREFVDLHMALARQYLAGDEFAAAQKALRAVLKVEPDQPAAAEYLAAIEDARQRAPQRAAEAVRLGEIELFEPAMRILKQAESLRPDQGQMWAGSLRQALLGQADDDYICRNFAQSAHGYAELTERFGGLTPAVADRWAAGMVAAMAEEIEAGRFVSAHWVDAVSRIVPVLQRRGDVAAVETLAGLDAEAAGKSTAAGNYYLRARGRPAEQPEPPSLDELAQLRGRAVAHVLQRFEPAAVDRRSGAWAISLSGPPRTRQTTHFRIHHRNDLAALRVGQAMEHHWPKLIEFLGGDPTTVNWPEPADVYLHLSAAALAAATSRPVGTGAATSLRAVEWEMTARAIHLRQDDPMLLSSTVPHEMVHLLAATIYGAQRVSSLLGEGLAVQAECPARHRMYARLAREQPVSLNDLLNPRGAAHMHNPTFYAQAWSFVDFLLASAPRPDVARFCAETPSSDTAARLPNLLGLRDLKEVEAQWRRYSIAN